MRGCTRIRAVACAPEGSPVGAGVRVGVGAGDGGQFSGYTGVRSVVIAQVFW